MASCGRCASALSRTPSGKTVGRVTVQEGDGLEDASKAMLQARRYACDSEGSRAAEMEAEPGSPRRFGP
jgi:hypothetical protein